MRLTISVTSSLRVRVTIRETLRDTVLSPQIAECQTVLASIVVKSCKDEGLSGLRVQGCNIGAITVRIGFGGHIIIL